MSTSRTSLDAQIIEFSNVIAFYAKRLSLLRGSKTAQDIYNRGYLSGDKDGSAYNTISPWYRLLEPIYAELERLIQQASEADAARILADQNIKSLLGHLFQIRAAYEFDKEIDVARSILDRPDSADYLADMINHQSYWILTEPVLKALDDAKNVAVIGSGPLPLTALGVTKQTNASVTCFELNREAYDLGNQIIALSTDHDRITCLNALAKGGEAFEKFDAVISAVLLGVDLDSTNHIPKSQTLNGFLNAMPAGAPVILRDPFRLGGLFYPSVQTDQLTQATIKRFDPDTAPGEPYRSSFLILHAKDAV